MIPAIGSTLPKLDIAPVSAPGAATPAVSSAVAPANDFGAMLSQMATDAVNTVKTAEATSIKGVNGEASTQAVVEAVMSAERTLQTAVAIRDKAVAAYSNSPAWPSDTARPKGHNWTGYRWSGGPLPADFLEGDNRCERLLSRRRA